MYYGFCDLNTESKWEKQLNLLKEFSQRDDMYVTIVSPYDSGTFGEDNNQYILSFVNQQFKNAQMNGDKLEDVFFSVVIRQFTNIKNPNNISQKRVAICMLKYDNIYPASQKQTIDALTICAETGKPLKPEKGVTYIGFEEMLDYLNINT